MAGQQRQPADENARPYTKASRFVAELSEVRFPAALGPVTRVSQLAARTLGVRLLRALAAVETVALSASRPGRGEARPGGDAQL